MAKKPDKDAAKKNGAKKAPPKKAAPKKAAAKKAAPKAAAQAAPKAVAQAAPPQDPAATAEVLDRLWQVVMERRTADPSVSHSARLLARGTGKVAQKFGEEAVECVIEAVQGNKAALIGESADVLYHLLVVWVASGVSPAEVWAELHRREGMSGIAEKASRARVPPVGVGTTKIP